MASTKREKKMIRIDLNVMYEFIESDQKSFLYSLRSEIKKVSNKKKDLLKLQKRFDKAFQSQEYVLK